MPKIDRKETAKIIAPNKKQRELHGNGYKTACTTAVLAFFGIDGKTYRYSQFVSDMKRVFERNGWKAKPCNEHKGALVKNLNEIVPRGFYCVEVWGHVFLAYVSDTGELSFPVDRSPDYKNKYTRIQSLHKIELKRKARAA